MRNFCSDFPKESNGIFVLGVGFFLQINFDFLSSHFGQNFFLSFKNYCYSEPKFEKSFTCDHFLLKKTMV